MLGNECLKNGLYASTYDGDLSVASTANEDAYFLSGCYTMTV